MSKSLVLLSGGMDSATALAEKIHVDNKDVAALSFTYGSKHNERESFAAERLATYFSVERHLVELDFNRWGFKSDLLTSGGKVPEGHYADESMKATVVPFRNGILLAIAAGIAESRGYDEIVYAAHAGDHPIYPDCRPAFYAAMGDAVALGTDNKVSISAPFIGRTKTEICTLGDSLKVPFDLTWSCYQPTSYDGVGIIHCGRCGTCVERKEAFTDAKVHDPTIYYFN